MKECHRCQFHAELMAGKHKGIAWKKTPCSTCPAADLDKRGQINGTRALRGRIGENRLSLDHETLEVVEREAVLHDTVESLDHGWEDMLNISARLIGLDPDTLKTFLSIFADVLDFTPRSVPTLRAFVEKLLNLDRESLDIVLQRVACRGSIKEMAETMGISTQTAHARMKAAMRKHEWVAELITIKERKKS
jgi:hypothetical protein